MVEADAGVASVEQFREIALEERAWFTAFCVDLADHKVLR